MTVSGLTFVSHVELRDGRILRDGKVVLDLQEVGQSSWAVSAYAQLGVEYPKFYRMDPLARIAILGTQVLLAGRNLLDAYDPFDIGVVLVNRHASLDADHRYLQASQHLPSPALFVYTLPNIAIGEICIRYGFKGHNVFLLEPAFDPQALLRLVGDYHRSGMARAYICGWVDSWKERHEADLFLAIPMDGNTQNDV